MEEEYEIQHFGFSVAELRKESKKKKRCSTKAKFQF